MCWLDMKIYVKTEIMKDKFIEAVPIINEHNEVEDIVFWNDEFGGKLSHYDINI